MKRLIIAIDGPAASGKSTTAKLLAQKLGYVYLDTGAMYRACALAALEKGVKHSDAAGLDRLLQKIDLRIEYSPTGNKVLLQGVDVTKRIREEDISRLSSDISTLGAVRAKMVELQRRMGAEGGVIMDGRDIGTVVFPRADLKFFLNATAEERARRRCRELQAKGEAADYDTVLQEMLQRDRQDSTRDLAPLKPADDAIPVDTTDLTIEQQVQLLYRHICDKLLQSGGVEIRLALHSGFCFGVRRAIELALKAGKAGQPVYTMGPLIHSPQMVQQLRQDGITPAEDAASLRDSTVIIRSHGITRQERETLVQNGNTLIDATCPFVEKAQANIRQLCREGYPVIVLGDRDHPEVVAMLSYCEGETLVVTGRNELPDRHWKKLGVISQTTKNTATLQELVAALAPRVKELRLFNTICTATSLRQEATAALAARSDLMVIIGGRNSSNTRMLFQLSSALTTTLHIETADELTPEQVAAHCRIGLSAGASTPDHLIVNVYNRINKLTGNRTTVTSVEDIPVN